MIRVLCYLGFLVLALVPSVRGQDAVAQQPANPPQYRYWTTHWSFDDIDVGKLLSRLESIGIQVPIQAQGDVSLDFDVSIPLNGLREGGAYRFNGTLRSTQLQLEQLLLADFSTTIEYEAGTLALRNLSTRWLDLRAGTQATNTSDSGRLTGEVNLEVIPRGALSANLHAERLAIAPLYDLILTASSQPAVAILDGDVSGSLAVNVPLDSIRTPSTWTIDADLQASSLSLAESTPLTIDTGAISLRNGVIKANDVRVESPADPQIKMVAAISAGLTGERPFEFDIKGNDVPLQSLVTLASLGPSTSVTGTLDLDAHGSGKLATQDIAQSVWTLAGRIASPELSVLGVRLGLIQHAFEFDSKHVSLARLNQTISDQVIIDRLLANYSIDENTAELTDLDAAVFGGTITGSATFARNEQGTDRVKLSWENINPQLNTTLWLPQSLKVSLQSSGEIDGFVPAQSLDQPAAYNGVAKIKIDQLRIGSEKVGDGQIDLRASDGQLSMEGQGELFGGSYSVHTTTSLAAVAGWFDLSASGRLGRLQGNVRFNQVGLGRAARLLNLGSHRRIDGFVSGAVTLVPHDNSELPQTVATLSFDNVAVDGTVLTHRLVAELSTDDIHLTVNSIRGSYAGGYIEAMGRIAMLGGVGRLQIRAAAIDASAGLMPISMSASQAAGGKLSGRLIVETGRSLWVSGTVEVRDSRIFSIPAGDAHAAIVGSADNDLSSWTLRVRSIESAVDQGRILGEAVMRSSTIRPGAFDLTSRWQARRLDFGRLLADAGGGKTSYAKGNIDGTLELNGTGIRTTADLTGRFAAELDGTQARAVPGLASAQAYLGAFSLAGTRFDQGRLRGSIGAGTARIDEFRLTGQRLQVIADGRVQLANGRMDVTAVISTGNFDVESAAVGALAQQLAVGAAPPAALFIEVNRLLSNRTLYVDVLGPLTDPRLRLKPLKNLESGLARFVVREATATFLPVVTGSGVLASGQDR